MNNKHPLVEDFFALLSATITLSLGVYLLVSANIISGGLTGLAMLLTHVTSWTYGTIFFVINIPFYVLAYARLGWRFTLNTLIAVTMSSIMVDNLDLIISFNNLEPVYASIAGGIFAGIGILILARHNSSAGGLNIFVFYLQERFGLRAGYIQMALDTCIVLAGSFFMTLEQLALAVLTTITLNLAIGINHKPGRYKAQPA